MLDNRYLVKTRLGWVAFEWGDKGLRRLVLPRPTKGDAEAAVLGFSDGMPEEVRDFGRRLCAYFDGEPVAFTDPVDMSLGTDFQQAVWRALRDIPSGTTLTYGQLAQRVGKPRAARAVGQAVGANPVPIVIPCHRVVAADGGLGGYTGADLSFKAGLLRMEAAVARKARSS